MKTVLSCLLLISALGILAVQAENPPASELERGKAITFDRNAGNCLACHAIDDGELPGNSGPPLMQMSLRFPDRNVLRTQIWDATVRNPNTVMPPYGKHKIFSDEEVDLVVDYLLTL